MTGVKSRTAFLELLRIIACFFVIVNHTNSRIFLGGSPPSLTWFASLTYFFISKIAVPIFFMISGYLLLSKIDNYKKYFQRILRIVIALIGCGFVYAVFHTYYKNPSPSFSNVIKEFLDIHLTAPTRALWYLYAYLGILLMLPFLQKMASLMTRRDYHLFFVLSGFFVSLLPILNHYFPSTVLNSDFQLPLFGGYICMLFIGQYFSRYPVAKTKWGFALASLIFLLSVAFNVAATYFEYQKSGSGYLFFDNRIFLPIVLQSVCIFYLVSFVKLSPTFAKVISYIGSCTFGIYLLSDMSIIILEPIYNTVSGYMHSLFAVVIYEVCVFAAGLAVIAVLKFLPFVKKVL